VGTSPRAGVVETRVYVLVDTRPPLQDDHELFMRPEDSPVAGPFVFLAERGVRQLPNPPIDMPEWLEDTRS
jgi:hypothetical protein